MSKDKEEIKENIFKIVQGFLKKPPLIVWGSGATISFGLPSMGDLNKALKEKIGNFNTSNDNLEIELGKEKYRDQMPEIKKVIWDKVNEADKALLKKVTKNNSTDFCDIKFLVEKFVEAHPQILNIVTTNYDRVLEYVMSFQGISFTDGFNGKLLSKFDENLFKKKNIVNLIKVHGSLNWFIVDDEIRYLNSNNDQPQIIVPGKNKYQEAYSSPYRELIQKADNVIKESSSFLVIGFGFNDEHLTPRIRTQLKKGIPIVLITKEVSDSTFEELKNARKYLLFEKLDNGRTKVIYKKSDSETRQEEELDGDFWKLIKFMEIL